MLPSSMATIRIRTSNSSSNRRARWNSKDVWTRGQPSSEPLGWMLRPAARQSACSASSMYRKKRLKCTMPAMSVSWNCTRRRRRTSEIGVSDKGQDLDDVADLAAVDAHHGLSSVERKRLRHPEEPHHFPIWGHLEKDPGP